MHFGTMKNLTLTFLMVAVLEGKAAAEPSRWDANHEVEIAEICTSHESARMAKGEKVFIEPNKKGEGKPRA